MSKDDIWVTKDGSKMKMCKMTDSHLKNAIKYFEPHKNTAKKRWKLLTTEQKRRDDLIPNDPIESRFDILDF